MSLTRSQVKLIRAAMQKALDEAGIEDVTFEVGNCRFNETQATFKVAVSTEEHGDKQATELERAMAYHNVKSKECDAWVLTGYNPKRRKYPFEVKRTLTGSPYKMTPEQARQYFGSTVA